MLAGIFSWVSPEAVEIILTLFLSALLLVKLFLQKPTAVLVGLVVLARASFPWSI